MKATCDVAIVGAGVAGLAAMRTLEEHGLRTLVVEARERIGGRILTVHDPRLAHPIELGAEFVHGSAPEIEEIIGEARLLALQVEGERWRARGGRLTRLHEFWKRLDTVMRRLDGKDPDRSFADFLDDAPGGRGATDARRLAHQFVEGFHAADARRISAKALADGGSPGDDEEEQRMMRFASGYDAVPAFLASGFFDRIVTGSVVERIGWERTAVELSVRRANASRPSTIAARAAIVTIPLGVLLASAGEVGTIDFSPPLTVLDEARSCLTMGAVVRVILMFRERWWTEQLRSLPGDASLECMSFLHGDSAEVPVWWSLHPAHLPVLVGWAGGPAAQRLSGLSPSEVADRGLASLASHLGVSRRRVSSQLEHCWTHDWQRDPLSRGAYSYALVGGAEFAPKLARSIQGTLWLAGEAADGEGRNGTVHGAIGSGRHAARSVIRALQ
ncbi:MAG TPA: NAD(P)/FAD-dependent oxidoreductase [Gemmatimonadaceae bacterium]|nr:NAD(P)/FAD-dependent oxidoreductase [Gemmatimonadaceae bacterium]